MQISETQFETQRGVTGVEVRHGFAQVHVHLGSSDLAGKRIYVLRVLAEGGVSHKYLKLTQDGLAFIITEEQLPDTRALLDALGEEYTLNVGRSIILVSAINMREEHGLIAFILEQVIASGISIDHIGDMHNKMFVVVRGEVAEPAAQCLREQLTGDSA